MILPMILLIFLSVGGMGTAVDLFAGEKERRTFEPLLCTKVRRTDILAGKLGAVVLMALCSALFSIFGIVAGYMVSPQSVTMGLDDVQGFSISPAAAVLVIGSVILLAVMFSGIHVLLSTFARSVKEASAYGTFVMLGSYVPIFMTMSMQGGDFQLWSAFIPVLNTIGCLKMALSGITDLSYMLVTILVSAALVAIVLALGRMMFKKETIMLRA
jgi:sodium transport system permease protein